ncbi:hypothetical protein Lal_00025663 [Lupinus albus]|nr:hypothetical protein Lal_00025663 [Lupinus albus]
MFGRLRYLIAEVCGLGRTFEESSMLVCIRHHVARDYIHKWGEGHAASIYTRVVFKEFREILLEAAKLRIISSQQTSSHVIYKIGKHYNPNKK